MNSRALVTLATALLTMAGMGQIVLKPNGQTAMPLRTKALKARVTIEKQIAVSNLEVTFENQVASRIEADFIYTLPENAVVSFFAYYYGDERVVARIAEKERAAAIYQHITSRMRDPALVEMIGKRTFRARIFPIMPNADLRVEMTVVQALRSEDDRYSYVLSLHAEKGRPLGSLDVEVSVRHDEDMEKVVSNFARAPLAARNVTKLRLNSSHYHVHDDLKVTVIREPKPVRATLYAARSGGRDGFFALQVSADSQLDADSVSIGGIKTYFLNRTSFSESGGKSVLITGRYSGAGKARVVVPASVANRANAGPLAGAARELVVTFPETALANNPATKMWASAEMDRLAEQDADADKVVELSLRYGLPSKFTSWLAIPEEERARYMRETKWAELNAAARQYLQAYLSERKGSARLQKLHAQLLRRAEEAGTHLKAALSSACMEAQNVLAADLTKEITEGRSYGPRALKLRRQIEDLHTLGGQQTRQLLTGHLWRELDNTAHIVVPLLVELPEDPTVQALHARHKRLVSETIHNPNYYIDAALSHAKHRIALAVVYEEQDPMSDRSKVARMMDKLSRLEAFSGSEIGATIRLARAHRRPWELMPEDIGRQPVSVTAVGSDIRDVLRALLKQVKISYTIAPAVQGAVTLSMQDVPFETAIQNVVRQVGATYRVELGVLQIVPRQPPPIITNELVGPTTVGSGIDRLSFDSSDNSLVRGAPVMGVPAGGVPRAQARDLEIEESTKASPPNARATTPKPALNSDGGKLAQMMATVAGWQEAVSVTLVLPDGRIKSMEYSEDRGWHVQFEWPVGDARADRPLPVVVHLRDGTYEVLKVRPNLKRASPAD